MKIDSQNTLMPMISSNIELPSNSISEENTFESKKNRDFFDNNITQNMT